MTRKKEIVQRGKGGGGVLRDILLDTGGREGSSTHGGDEVWDRRKKDRKWAEAEMKHRAL